VKVSKHGILSILPTNKKNCFLMQLNSGQISYFNIKSKKEIYLTEVGHTRQIQKCKVHPNNPMKMASCGFDGYLRIWDLGSLELDAMIEDRTAKGLDKVLQSIAWCPIKPKPGQKDTFSSLCAVATSEAKVKLFDTSRNKVIQSVDVDKDSDTKCIVFDLDWNSDGLISVATSSYESFILKFDMEKRSLEVL
jgi:WD40 repeat protein